MSSIGKQRLNFVMPVTYYNPYLPRNVCLPASPCLTKMLQDGPCFVLLDSFRHHVQNVVHDCCPELQIIVTLHSLLSDCFCDSLGVATLKLPGKQIAQPSLKKWDNATQEKQPDTPPWRPDPAAWAFANWSLKQKKLIEELYSLKSELSEKIIDVHAN